MGKICNIFLFLQWVSTVIIVYIIISPLNSYLYIHWILDLINIIIIKINIIIKLCKNKIPIQQVDNTKFLGRIIDDNLNWSNHIYYINSKIAEGIGIIYRARKFFSKSTLINDFTICYVSEILNWIINV